MTIVTLADQDSREIARQRLQFLRLAPYLAMLCLATETLYLTYRIILFKSVAAPTFAVTLFLLVEVFNAFSVGLTYLQCVSILGKATFRLPRRIEGNGVSGLPSVDILIPCCGEDLDLIKDTLDAALDLDYPVNSHRIILLDDRNNARVQRKVTDMAKIRKRDNLFYTSRMIEGSRPAFAKAGNLNHGLKYASKLPHGPAEFIAVLDADMMPQRHWLRTMLVDLMLDNEVALTNPPQRYYNIPNTDPFSQDMGFFYDGIEPIKNCVSSAWCTGTGFVVRREALEQIGLFPTDSPNEDLVTAFYLNEAGWKVSYVHEDVQWGLVPSSVHAHLSQQRRWLAGLLYTIESLWHPRVKDKTTIVHRIGPTITCASAVFCALVSGMSLCVVPWLLLQGSQILEYQTSDQLRSLLLIKGLTFGATSMFFFLRCRAADFTFRMLSDWAPNPPIAVVPYQCQAFLLFCCPAQIANLIRNSLGLIMRTSPANGSYEPSNAFRVSAIRKSGLEQFHIVYLSGVFGLCLAGGFRLLVNTFSQPEGNKVVFWVTHGGFPPLAMFWSGFLSQAWTQIFHMTSGGLIWASRETLLSRDEKSGVARPCFWATQTERKRPWQDHAVVAAAMHVGVVALALTL